MKKFLHLTALLYIIANYSFCQGNKDISINELPRYSLKIGAGPNYIDEFFSIKHLGINFCPEINYLKGKHFTFGTGLYFYSIYEKIKSHPLKYNQINIATNPFYYSPFQSSDYVIETNKKQYFSLPLNVNYHFTNQKTGFYIGAGLRLNYNFRAYSDEQGYQNNGMPNLEATTLQYHNLDYLTLSIAFKTGLSFYLSKNIYGYIEPEISSPIDYRGQYFLNCNVGGSYFF